MTDKEFSVDWTTPYTARWRDVLSPWREHAVRILEIGSWEGRSALFFLEFLPRSTIACIDTFEGAKSLLHLPEHQPWVREISFVEGRFDRNLSAFGARVEKLKGASTAMLNELIVAERRFDLIYVDGSHRADDVRSDSARAWRLLEPNGVMIWDDYTWRPKYPPSERPQPAIDEFLITHSGEYVLLEKGDQVIIRRDASTVRS